MTRKSLEGIEYEIAPPPADALIESIGSVGYTAPEAVADLIDNSITANASKIEVVFEWQGTDSYVVIGDDGDGMDEAELRRAMALASSHPLDDRKLGDLGRFGLGLKTASFSQCRSLTVVTKQDGKTSVRQWDREFVNRTGEWALLVEHTELSRRLADEMLTGDTGTIVVWEQVVGLLERTGSSDGSEHLFYSAIRDVESHIGMVFHRFLSERPAIQITINGDQVQAWDPFLSNHIATQSLASEVLSPSGRDVGIRPYVLPHITKMKDDPKSHEAAGGIAGWNAQQGFYIYREKRLLVAGTWFDFFKKEEHYKLARIRVDITSESDRAWDTDVKKSDVKPPAGIREDLKRVAEVTRREAVKVYRHRGKVIAGAGKSTAQPWLSVTKSGDISYRINRQHPLVETVLASRDVSRSTMVKMIELLEETVPVQQIWINEQENPDGHAAPFEHSHAKLDPLFEELVEILISQGKSEPQALKEVARMEPFSDYAEISQQYAESKGLKL